MEKRKEDLLVPGLFEKSLAQHPMLRRIGVLVGTWVGSGDYYDGVNVYPDRKAVHTYEWTCAGQVLVWKILSHGPLKFYQSLSAIVWDDRVGLYRASYYDNLQTVDTMTAQWNDDSTLEMSFQTGFAFLGPEVASVRHIIARESDTTQRWRLEVDRGAGWEAVIVQSAYRLF
jgi:hypothetical protein